MDRNRKTGKPHHPIVGSHLIALGKSKPTTSGSTSTPPAGPEPPEIIKSSTSSSLKSSSSKGLSSKGSSVSSGHSKSGSSSGNDKRREGGPMSGAVPPKKIKLHSSSSSSSSSAAVTVLSSSSTAAASGSAATGKSGEKTVKREVEDVLKQISSLDLNGSKFRQIMAKAEEVGDEAAVTSLLIGSLKRLRQMKEKPDLSLCQALLLCGTEKAIYLRSPAGIEAMCALAKTSRPGVDIRNRHGQYFPIMCAALGVNMMLHSHADVVPWPLNFLQVWLEDACHERYWVDRPECKNFVGTLTNSLKTMIPEKDLLPPAEQGSSTSGSSSPAMNVDLEPGFEEELAEIIQEEESEEVSEKPSKFSEIKGEVETIIVDYAKDIIQKKSPELPKNLFRMLGSACGLQGVRSFIISRIEQWLHNPKCSRQAQELLMYVCVNAKSYKSPDGGIYIPQLCKLRMKTKQLTHLFSVGMREMVRDDEQNLRNVLVQIVYNELSLQRNPTNYPVLGSILSALPEARSELAQIFMDLLMKREDFIVAIRQIMRDSMRACRFDCDLSDFVVGLLGIRELSWPEGMEMRNRAFKNIIDLVIFSLFLSFTPNVKEAVVNRTEKNLGVVTNFHNQIAKMQEEALSWLYCVAINLYRPPKADYVAALHKLVLKDLAADLNYKENWPTESDRNMFARHCLEIPLLESSFMWVLLQAFSKEHTFFTAAEILELTEMMIMKAAVHGGRIEITKTDLFESLFKLAEYKHPENIALPVGYTPPKLGITKSCWRVWTMLLILASYNPADIGKKGWETLPTLKVLMEMCMTNHFTYPTLASIETVDEVISRELQMSAIEKEQILEFESHLAAGSTKATITERSSILLSQLITLDPCGNPRTPWVPPHLKSLNDQLKLGYRLCRSRDPDFLVDLMQRNSNSMPWLSELVTEGSFEILPVRSLCEFIVGQTDRLVKITTSEADGVVEAVGGGDKSPKKGHKSQSTEVGKEDSKSLQLLHFLQNAVQKTEQDNAKEILEFFFRRLSFPKTQNRTQGIQALQLLFSTPKKPLDDAWLLETIPMLPLYSDSDVRTTITKCLRQAIQFETEPAWIARYLEFLSVWGVVDSDTISDNLALDVTQLVVERCIVIQSLLQFHPEAYESLFSIYIDYMKKVRGPGKDTHQWSESIEQVLVKWEKADVEATLNILIVHAIVILLSSYAKISAENMEKKKGKGSSMTEKRYVELLEMWFPVETEYAPKALLLNTVEEAVLFPDWIKLRMIRSSNPRLLVAASEDLNIDQLVLFVQSFGIPVQSMTGLLYCLDKAVEEKPAKVSEAILDPKYMSTIVEVQWKRGAKGGEKLFNLLSQLAAPEDENIEKFEVPNTHSPRPVLSISDVINSKIGEFTLKKASELDQTMASGNSSRRSSTESTRKEDIIMDTSTADDMDIRNLSKRLLLLTSPSTRRRSSVPMFDNSPTPAPVRRYSMTQERKPDVESSDILSLGKGNTVGQLVDTIREVEPCIVKNALDVQLPLIFGRSDVPPHCRAFLLTVLTHESGWKTVEDCLSLFLGDFVPCYDPSAVLDLIASTISNPKLWQGCDKYVPKHQQQLPVLDLSAHQLLVMAEYIIEEINQMEMKNTKFSISNLLCPTESFVPNGKKTKHCLQERVSLWLLCCHHDKEVVDAAMNALSSKKSRNPCTKKFLAQIYVDFPQVILTETWKEKPEDLITGDENVSCVLDTVSHILINAVATVQSGKEWAKKIVHEQELCLRKVASVHPTLLLRQLPLMGILLQGRIHLEFEVFHAQNHNVPFKVFLGLFDLMQPHILKQFKILKPILTLYMQMLENFGHLKDYSTTLSRYCVLLHNLLSNNPSEMKDFLGSHYLVLKDLSTESYYLEVGPLQALMTSVVAPSSSSEVSILTQNTSEIFSLSSKQSNEIFDRFEHAQNNDELMASLQELESLATRNPAVLHQFSDHLNSLLLSDLENCRQIAFSLILKHMTYYPGAHKVYLKSILQAMKYQGWRTMDTLLERIPEFIVLAQDNAGVIMTEMFDLALSSSTMLPIITRTLTLLRSQIGA